VVLFLAALGLFWLFACDFYSCHEFSFSNYYLTIRYVYDAYI